MIREELEKLEHETLSPKASFSDRTIGREQPMEKCTLRTEYMRDRDRILHSKSFRRLKHKTQVFYSPEGDHYRTRLTHTLEVAQISRTIARCLFLNEDLTEAAALGHDLGHTPFGHAGERVLSRLTDGCFTHNEQSLRVVEKLENNGKGLNLTYEVRDGIVHHTGPGKAGTLEGRIIRFADRIAYINHDIDDAIRAGIIAQSDIPADCTAVLGATHGQRIDTMIRDVVTASRDLTDIRMSDEIYALMNELRAFMFDRVYVDSAAKQEEGKAEQILESLYSYYMSDVTRLPEESRRACDLYGEQTAVCDYLAGMTDRYAVNRFVTLFIPKSWQNDGFCK